MPDRVLRGIARMRDTSTIPAAVHVPVAAIVLITSSVLCFTALDAITKYLTQRYTVPLLVWARLQRAVRCDARVARSRHAA